MKAKGVLVLLQKKFARVKFVSHLVFLHHTDQAKLAFESRSLTVYPEYSHPSFTECRAYHTLRNTGSLPRFWYS